MGCIYSDFNGQCTMHEDGQVNTELGAHKNGACLVEDDPDPSRNCDTYESDSTCFDCGADFNQDGHCTCED